MPLPLLSHGLTFKIYISRPLPRHDFTFKIYFSATTESIALHIPNKKNRLAMPACIYAVSMKRLKAKYFFNKLLAYQEKAVRYKHHVTLFEHYLKCNTVPKGFVLKFHSGITNSIMQSPADSMLKKCSIKLMCSFKSYYKQNLRI